MKSFASQADLAPKKIAFQKLSKSCYAFTTEGDANTGVIVGDDAVMLIDAQATPLMAREVIRRIRCAREGVKQRKSLKDVYMLARRHMDPKYGKYPIYEHCMPFDVSRAYDEARGLKHPRIWTATRDREMWKSIA
jgi:hypothetical protein